MKLFINTNNYQLTNICHIVYVTLSYLWVSSEAGSMRHTECWLCVTKADVSITTQLHSYLCSCPSSLACSLVRAIEFTWSSLHSVKSCLLAFVLRLACQAVESRGPLSTWLHSKWASSVLLSSPPPPRPLSTPLPFLMLVLVPFFYTVCLFARGSSSPHWDCQLSSYHSWVGEMSSYLSLLGNGLGE